MSARDLQRQALREAAIQDAAVVRFDAELKRVYGEVPDPTPLPEPH